MFTRQERVRKWLNLSTNIFKNRRLVATQIDDTYYLEKQNWFLTWSKSSHHWFSFVFLTGTPAGGSQTHSPVVKFAYMCSFVRGSIISTHSVIGGCGEHGAPVVVPPAKGFRISESGVNGLRLILRRSLEVKSPIRI